jgi:hypothetical protein
MRQIYEKRAALERQGNYKNTSSAVSTAAISRHMWPPTSHSVTKLTTSNCEMLCILILSRDRWLQWFNCKTSLLTDNFAKLTALTLAASCATYVRDLPPNSGNSSTHEGLLCSSIELVFTLQCCS